MNPNTTNSAIQLSMDQLRPGDLLFRQLQGIDGINIRHYGCYAGKDSWGRHIVFEHCNGKSASYVFFEDFALGKKVTVQRVLNIDRNQAIRRMEELRISKPQYDLIFFNCETAARYVCEGKKHSPQVIQFAVLAGLSFGIYLAMKNAA